VSIASGFAHARVAITNSCGIYLHARITAARTIQTTLFSAIANCFFAFRAIISARDDSRVPPWSARLLRCGLARRYLAVIHALAINSITIRESIRDATFASNLRGIGWKRSRGRGGGGGKVIAVSAILTVAGWDLRAVCRASKIISFGAIPLGDNINIIR